MNKTSNIKDLLLAVEQGDAEALDKLRMDYFWSDNNTKDRIEALKWLRKVAELGNAEAQCELGDSYLHGWAQDDAEAVKWWSKAAEQGYAPALNILSMYQRGENIPFDNTEGTIWIHKNDVMHDYHYTSDLYSPAKFGDIAAQTELGNAFFNGDGGIKDKTRAVEWWRKAADQGSAEAQFNLGYAYFEGNANDYTEAVRWYRLAAEQGYALAQSALSLMYGEGYGVPRDEAEALKWLRKAAKQGLANAQSGLALVYYNGEYDVTPNRAVAKKWWQKAAAQGYEHAQECLFQYYGWVKDF